MKEKKDKLKDFIQQHKEGFEEELPPVDGWLKLEKGLAEKESVERKKRVLLTVRWSVAATIALLFMVGAVAYYMGRQDARQIARNEKPRQEIQFSLGAVSAELAEVENYYNTQINEKLEESKQLQIDPENFSELELLKAEYKELEKEMGQNIDNEMIIQAMIENYRLRLEILNTILNEIKAQKGISDDPEKAL